MHCSFPMASLVHCRTWRLAFSTSYISERCKIMPQMSSLCICGSAQINVLDPHVVMNGCRRGAHLPDFTTLICKMVGASGSEETRRSSCHRGVPSARRVCRKISAPEGICTARVNTCRTSSAVPTSASTSGDVSGTSFRMSSTTK